MLSHGSERGWIVKKRQKGERCIMIIEWNNVLSGVIVLTLWCGLLISFGLAFFYSGKAAYEIIYGETNYRELFQRTLATIGVGDLFYMIIELFLKNVGMLK